MCVPDELCTRTNIESNTPGECCGPTLHAGRRRDQSDDRQRINGSRNSIYRVIISACGVRPSVGRSGGCMRASMDRNSLQRRPLTATRQAPAVRRSPLCRSSTVFRRRLLSDVLVLRSVHNSSENIDPRIDIGASSTEGFSVNEGVWASSGVLLPRFLPYPFLFLISFHSSPCPHFPLFPSFPDPLSFKYSLDQRALVPL